MTKKHDNFVRLAESRVNKALEAIRIIGNLSNPSYYEYSETEVKEIVAALTNGISEIKSQFSMNVQNNRPGFRFSSSQGSRQKNNLN